MESYFMAQIILFAGNFAPRSYMFCQGQLLSISQNTALFALLGTIYGGDGQNTFGLPDFRGRIPVGAGQGSGLTYITLGEQGGWNSATLTTNQIPSHTHIPTAIVGVNSASGNTANPGGAVISGGNSTYYAPAANATGPLSGISATVQPAGSNQSLPLGMPSLGINFVIAVEGIFPARN